MAAKKPIYWSRERFEAARKRGRFTEEEKAKSENWTTCACGQQDARIPREAEEEYGAPSTRPCDPELRELGCLFSDFVVDGRVDLAEATLKDIEERAAIVLAEAIAKP